MENFIREGANRVILCTDGDFNVGVTSTGDLTRIIQQKAKSGVFLTVLGFGMGNYKDAMLEKLAEMGNGNYGYIDSLAEAKKMLVEQLSGTLVTIAKDVKIQVEFNPIHAAAYRLIGYENRLLRKEDFNDDGKDAGEIGSGHTVTALYEIVPATAETPRTRVDRLKYQQPATPQGNGSPELMTVKLRYKQPDGETSVGLNVPVIDAAATRDQASHDFKFAAAVAAFGMVLRDSEYGGAASISLARQLAKDAQDGSEYRREFLELLQTAATVIEGAAPQRASLR